MRKYEKMYLYFCIGNSVFRETLQASLSHAGFYYINADKTSTYTKYKFSAPRPEELDKVCTSYNLLKDYYPVFSKSDDVVANAARAIAEIITVPGYINTDFADVYNTLKSGNVAIMSVGKASGEKRITKAIHNALHSPLINTDVHGATRLLLQLYTSTEHAVGMAEMSQIHDFVSEIGEDVDVQWGASLDETLGEDVRVTIIATGFEVSNIPGLDNAVGKKTVDEAIEDFYGGENNVAGKSVEPPVSEPLDLKIVVGDTDDEIGEIVEDPKPIVHEDGDVLINFDIEDTPSSLDESAQKASVFAGWMRGRK